MQKVKNFLENLLNFSSKKKTNSKIFLDFLKNFYLQNRPQDFKDYSLEELEETALHAYQFFFNKEFNQFKIRITNLESSKYTFLEILNDDMPFLVDSLVAQLYKLGIEIKNIIHPIYYANRDKDGNLQNFLDDNLNLKSLNKESLIQFHLEKISSNEEIEKITKQLIELLKTIKLVVGDFTSMVKLAHQAKKELKEAKLIADDAEEMEGFIEWIANGNFIFLGVAEFETINENNKIYLKDKARFGICASEFEHFRPRTTNASENDILNSIKYPYIIEVLKSRYKSQIHRIANAERIRIQKISPLGKIIGEYRFFGLFTSSAYHQNAKFIPLIKNKITSVVTKAGFIENSHNYKDLISVLESYPKDELFQISVEDLFKISTEIVSICGRPQVRFFTRLDKFSRFVSCLIFSPRDRSGSEFREKVRFYLTNIYNGEITDSYVHITDSNLMRFHIIVRTDKGIPEIDVEVIEQEIAKMIRIWSDDLKQEIAVNFSKEKIVTLFRKYKNAFSSSYQNYFSVNDAILDISKIEECLERDVVLFNLYKSPCLAAEISELKIYSPQKELLLSEIMPIVESFGFNMIHEHTYIVNPNEEKNIWVHYFHLNLSKAAADFSKEIKNNFEETISLTWQNITNDDFLNRLIVAANLNWRQVYLLRAYMKYIYQTGFRYSEKYISEVLVKYHEITKLLVILFETKFDPRSNLIQQVREVEVAMIYSKITQELTKISDLLEDSVIRKFFAVINATLRTNYFQTTKDNLFKGYVSFKFDSKKIPSLPLPVPYAEIFVYSTAFEAIHLRGGKVARGGLRWSDRYEDFRTEVLGLMKAQMTKNSVIVPVGSKGGFVVKKSALEIKTKISSEQYLKEGIECYKNFLRGALDITDNILNGKIIHPKHAIIYDEADPYLVVAADKGTATFSDIANSISAEYNFWLGDAFASGGSVGYDHKKMGITAKGAWISVVRHFREINIDIDNQDFTCVGIGDLSGDVFGNGMIISNHAKLIAAFNHLHIFLDPNPDRFKSFNERQRIFNLERSTWLDYNHELISKGGGVFERSAKSIKLSFEIKKMLAIKADEMTPSEVIRAILMAPIDLLWNGGIGTYVKATDESNQDVGDKINDELRINGAELRCKVVGEGGNLGFTQKGRIEYHLCAGKINTDAIDNSAGVDCSDHEVNIKIALIQALRSNKITLSQRDKILESMTNDVAKLVLLDNQLQTQAVSIATAQGYMALGDQSHFLDMLEKTGLLNRKVEFLPSFKEIAKRQLEKIGMTRPELCVMLSYSKMFLYNHILASNLIEDEYFHRELLDYFPSLMQEKFASEIVTHQLKKEIIATQLTNFIVNRGGITFIHQICQDSGFSVIEVVRSFIIACDSFRLREIWIEIENLQGKIANHIQTQMFLGVSKLLERSVMWLLRNHVNSEGSIAELVDRFQKVADHLIHVLPEVLAQSSKDSYEKKSERYRLNNVEKQLAVKIAALDEVASAFDISKISTQSHYDLQLIAKIYFAVGSRFELKLLRAKVANLGVNNYWQKLSSKTIIEDLYNIQTHLAKSIVDFNGPQSAAFAETTLIANWIKEHASLVERFDNFISELKLQPGDDISLFVIALNRLKSLVR
jgi:glutamate dehydrogenase